MGTLDLLLRHAGTPAFWWELAALLACLGTAFGIAWFMGRGRDQRSVWFGRFIVDGLLFPLLALSLTYAALTMLGSRQTVVLLRIALPVLTSLAGIRFLARVLTVVFPGSQLARAIERVFSWLAWIAAVMWILGLLQPVLAELEAIHFTLGKNRLNLLGLLEGALSAGVILVLTLWVSAALEARLMRGSTGDLSLRRVLANLVRAGLLVLGVLVALSTVGVDLTALSVLSGALGVGLGFGLQKLASNYVSGFVVLFERSLRIGDTVRVDSFEGQVMDIKTRYTLLRAGNGRQSIVPNEKLITERIENLSMAESRMLLTTDVGVSYEADVDLVQRVLCAAAASSARVLQEPAPAARLVNFGPDALEFQLLYWIGDPANGQLNVRSDVNLAVLKGLRAAGVEIPYPQRVVHLAPGAALALGRQG